MFVAEITFLWAGADQLIASHWLGSFRFERWLGWFKEERERQSIPLRENNQFFVTTLLLPYRLWLKGPFIISLSLSDRDNNQNSANFTCLASSLASE